MKRKKKSGRGIDWKKINKRSFLCKSIWFLFTKLFHVELLDFTATSPTTANHQLPPHQHNTPGVAEQQQPQQQHPEHEPLINLITSSAQRAHPLISSVITTGLSAYGASKSYSPSFRYAAESVESRVGVPVGNVVSAVGRQTGLDSALRRGLGGNRRGSSGGEQRADTKKRKTNNKNGDSEMGEESLKVLAQQQQQRQQQQNTLARMSDRDNQTPDVGATDRQVAAPNQTWPTRVVLSTYGFGAALNEESLKNLKYCLDWLRFLNAHLGKLVSALKSVVEELDDHRRSQMGEDRQANGGRARVLPASYESSRAVLAAKVESLKGDVVATMKKVVEVVSNYTGSALPENARELIKRTPLPLSLSSPLYLLSAINAFMQVIYLPFHNVSKPPMPQNSSRRKKMGPCLLLVER